MLNEGNIQEACERALSYGGVNFSNTNDGALLKNGIQNKGTEWNETQEGVLKAYFKNNPDTVVASMLGRTIYEVRKKAKEMGLKKSEKYLKEIRGKNLKKDKNGNHWHLLFNLIKQIIGIVATVAISVSFIVYIFVITRRLWCPTSNIK